MKALIGAVATALLVVACDDGTPTGQERETAATNQLINQASTAVGMPGISNFEEKRMMKMLYELRDNADLVTYSYMVDMHGRLHPVCPTTSVGYGIPFSAQFTAPARDEYVHNGGMETIYQPEPNGLYMPESTAATWVICLGPDNELEAVYVEPLIFVSKWPRHDVDSAPAEVAE